MGQEEKVINDVLLRIPFAKFGLVTVSLPSLSLLYCFLSAYLLDAEGINDTDCNVRSLTTRLPIKRGSFWFTLCILLAFRGCFRIGIRNDRNSLAYK